MRRIKIFLGRLFCRVYGIRLVSDGHTLRATMPIRTPRWVIRAVAITLSKMAREHGAEAHLSFRRHYQAKER